MLAVDSQLKIDFPKLRDPFWRLNNLYWIIDEHSNRVLFKMRPVQKKFFDEMWYWNQILKSRQHGFSTLIDIMALDLCLFNDNIEAGIIAHTKEAVQHIFATKIKYPYENLPPSIKSRIPALKCDANELRLENNSWLRVALSMRSSTLRFLHVSEHGKICAKYPAKAEELKTGTIPALHEGSYFFNESTAEGGAGDFYDACTQAMADTAREKKEGIRLNKMQCRFFYAGWHQDPKNTTDPSGIKISDELRRYFAELAANYGIELSEGQKAWYALKRDGANGLGRLMKREHSSTPQESFEQSVEGAVFGTELEKARTTGRIGFVPHDDKYPVYTFWDLGVGHPTCILFVQFVCMEVRIIDYHEEANRGIVYHCQIVNEKSKEGYIYAKHYVPHDASKRSRETGTPLFDTIEELLGVKTVIKVPRCEVKEHSIEAARQIFPHCFFDIKKTTRLLKCLSFYRYEWNDEEKRYSKYPVDDWSADGSDAFQGLGMAWMTMEIGGKVLGGFPPIPVKSYKASESYEYNAWNVG